MKRDFYKQLLDEAQIREGMIVDVVADLFDLAKQCMKLGKKFDPNTFLDALETNVGDSGTILIRCFTWDFCHGKKFDINSSPSQSGALGNIAMKRMGYERTRHPIYNWMVKGKWRDYLCSIDEKESFGKGSVFAWEEKNDNAIQLNVGKLQSNGITLFHYIEEKVGVPYRYIKDFRGEYVDHLGRSEWKTYSMYVRDLNYDIDTQDCVYDRELEERGIKKNFNCFGISINTYKIKELCEV